MALHLSYKTSGRLDDLTSLLEITVTNNSIKADFQKITTMEREKLKSLIRKYENHNDSFKNTVYYRDPMRYLHHDTLAWKAHNQFDSFLTKYVGVVNVLTASPEGISKLRELLEISINLDRFKRYVANINKDVMEAQITEVEERDRATMLTPIVDPFYTQFYNDCVTFGYDSDTVREKYFRNNRFIETLTKPKITVTVGSLDFENNRLRKRLLIHQKAELFQKYGEKVGVLNELLVRDNTTEYFYRYALIGLADYFLHKKVESATNTPIAEFDLTLGVLEGVVEGNNIEFLYGVPKFQQQDYMCAAASSLNGVYSLLGIKPTKTQETNISIAINAGLGNTATLPTLLAKYLRTEYGLRVALNFETNQLLHNNRGAVKREYFDAYLENLRNTIKEVKRTGVDIETTTLSVEDIIEKLNSGPYIMARWTGGITHYNLICGYDKETKVFYYFDPLYLNVKKLDFNDLENFSKTPFGKWGIHIRLDLEEFNAEFNKFKEDNKDALGLARNFAENLRE